jgi:YHS domain-containing protein
MARLIFFFILFFIFYYLLRYLFKERTSSGQRTNRKNEPEELVQDPHCLTYIPKQSALKKKIEGQVQYFCSEECMKNYIQKNKA